MFVLVREIDNKNITAVHASQFLKMATLFVTATYFLGFISYRSYWHLLAGTALKDSIGAHLRHAADAINAIFLVIASPLTDFSFFVATAISLPDEPRLLTSLILCVCASLIVGMIHVLIWGYRHRPLGRTYFRITGLLLISAACIAALSLFFLLQFETEALRVQSVLQPVRSDVLHEAMQNRSRDSTGNRIAVLERLLEKPGYVAEHITQRARQWFALDARDDQAQPRRHAFALTIFLIAAVTATCHLVYRTALFNLSDESPAFTRTGRIVMLFVCLSQFFMLSALCGTLGRNHTYPVLSLKVDSPENSPTHPVFLLDEDSEHLVIYDRLQFFQIKRIPKSRILSSTQLFHASPFQNCARSLEECVPCEAQGLRGGTVTGL